LDLQNINIFKNINFNILKINMNLDKLFECCKNRKDDKNVKKNEIIIINNLKDKMIFKSNNIKKTLRKKIIDE
tara:strand:+ start:309 stop:527 length:219 start_codon:yes stop_codon:yes gene_type:complete